MMQAFRTENNYRNASHLSAAELRAAMASREILQSTALAFDTQRQLRFELGGCRAVMPFGQCADGADTGSVRDIAVLTRVGRPTCFVIEGIDTDENGQTVYRLSRAEAQRMCKAEYLDQLQPGDILPCIVTHIEPFGAFCDVGCGISALLPIDCMSVSRISSPADLRPGQAVSVYIKNILPEKMKIKLVIVNHALSQSHRFELRYFITEGHLDHWLYSTPESHKRIETDFSVMACNPA